MTYEPEEYDNDRTANAIHNLAAAVYNLAENTGSLLYALKYSKSEGVSISEAVELAGRAISDGIELAADRLACAVQELVDENRVE